MREVARSVRRDPASAGYAGTISNPSLAAAADSRSTRQTKASDDGRRSAAMNAAASCRASAAPAWLNSSSRSRRRGERRGRARPKTSPPLPALGHEDTARGGPSFRPRRTAREHVHVGRGLRSAHGSGAFEAREASVREGAQLVSGLGDGGFLHKATITTSSRLVTLVIKVRTPPLRSLSTIRRSCPSVLVRRSSGHGSPDFPEHGARREV